MPNEQHNESVVSNCSLDITTANNSSQKSSRSDMSSTSSDITKLSDTNINQHDTQHSPTTHSFSHNYDDSTYNSETFKPTQLEPITETEMKWIEGESCSQGDSLSLNERNNAIETRQDVVADAEFTMGNKKSSCMSDPGVPSHSDSIEEHESEGKIFKSRQLTEYERVTVELDHNDDVKKEISLGKRIGMYQIRSNLGSGNFSCVKLARHVLTKEYVAIKILDKTKLDDKTQKLLSREIGNMERLHHPNIIRMYEVLETVSRLHMVMEYALGGDLYSKITSEGRLKEPVAQFVFAQITAAIQHMHTCHVIHRDLKAENIMFAGSSLTSNKEDEVHRKLHVKVGDFGFSTMAGPEQKLTTFCGSPPYAAPELFHADWYIGHYVDIWAMGVLVCFMLSGLMPFRAETIGKLKRLVLAGQYQIPSWLSANAKDLIRKILQPVPTERISIEGIKNSAWLAGQRFPDPIKQYKTTPNVDSEEATEEELTAEVEACRLMKELGISEELMESAENQAARSQVTGVYRIMLHRVHRNRRPSHMVTGGLSHSFSNPELNSKLPKSNKGNNSVAEKRVSRLCSII